MAGDEPHADARKPSIVPIYTPGSSVPRYEWVNGLETPADWLDFVSDVPLPAVEVVDVESSESVAEWRRESTFYLKELEKLRAEWMNHQQAVEAGRRAFTEMELMERPEIIDLLEDLDAEIADNNEYLSGFLDLTLSEINEIEEEIARARASE
jgi:hypothetical protein